MIGRIVSGAIEGKLGPATSQRRAVDRKVNTLDQPELTHRPVDPVRLKLSFLTRAKTMSEVYKNAFT